MLGQAVFARQQLEEPVQELGGRQRGVSLNSKNAALPRSAVLRAAAERLSSSIIALKRL